MSSADRDRAGADRARHLAWLAGLYAACLTLLLASSASAKGQTSERSVAARAPLRAAAPLGKPPGKKASSPPRAADVAKKATPEKRAPAQPPRGASSWRAYTKLGWRRGYVTLHSPGIDRRWAGYVLGPGDALLPRAEQQIRSVLASWRTGRSRDIDRRLIRLIAHVSDVFGGRPIRVISGFRETSHARRSHHKIGEAMDFSIDGVPNWALRDYLRTLDRTGVGYYPNSSFVHVDVRPVSAYWVDLSRPGAPPRYVASTPSSARSRAD
jgi:hypothetical protein